MRLSSLTPMLRTPDLRASVTFYEQVLRFTCTAVDESAGWACLRRDGVELMLATPNAHEPFAAPTFTGSLYLRTDDVDGLWAALKDRVRVCYPLGDFGYGMREFAIHDDNGYLLQFGQPIAD